MIIFGILSTEEEGLYYTKVFLGVKEYWEETKDVNRSWVYTDECDCLDFLEDIDPSSYTDYITVGYEIITDGECPDIKEKFSKAGLEYSPEFEKACIEEEGF